MNNNLLFAKLREEWQKLLELQIRMAGLYAEALGRTGTAPHFLEYLRQLLTTLTEEIEYLRVQITELLVSPRGATKGCT